MSNVLPVEGNFYPVENASKGVILFHAYTGSPRDFNLLARRLQTQGVEVYCPTFQGHNTLDIYDILDAHPDDWWIQAQEVLSYMQKRGYEKIGIFGLSLGGIFATRLLAEHHEDNLFGGVFNSPVYTYDKIDVAYFFDLYTKDLYNRSAKSQDYPNEKSKIMNLHLQQVQEIYYFTTSFQMSLQDIKAPFFIAQSKKDEMINPDSANLLKEVLINADVKLHWYENNTHVITVNRDREDFERDLTEFIQAQ